jgi:hypothetical protein
MPSARDERRPSDAELIESVVAVVPGEAAAEVVLDTARQLDGRGTVALLDSAIVARDANGATQIAELPPVPGAPAGQRLLTARDLSLIAGAVPPGMVALVVLLEDLWAIELAVAVRRVGGHIAGGERVPADRAAGLPPTRSGTDGS